MLAAVTLDEANRVARRLLDPDRAQIVVAGPWSGPGERRGRHLERLGAVGRAGHPPLQGPALTIRAVFFDVDFTLIYPGPDVSGRGLRALLRRRGHRRSTPARFEDAVAAASFILDEVEEPLYDDDLFVHYTATIIEHMGGRGAGVIRVARRIYEQWAGNHHFEMYDDVAPVLTELAARGLTLGAISNSHRSLDAFIEHFQLGR